jgi:hypothetical protein
MTKIMKPLEASHIPAPLRDWLDHAILNEMTDTIAAAERTQARKTSIANAILYPLDNKRRK